MVKKNLKKGQSFSTDILVVVAVLLFGVLFLVVNQTSKDDSDDKVNNMVDKVSEDSKVIVDELKNSNIIDSSNNVDVKNLMQINVNDLKEELNINSDFCIVFEKDGNLVKIDAENNINGIGSENIIVNDAPCKSS